MFFWGTFPWPKWSLCFSTWLSLTLWSLLHQSLESLQRESGGKKKKKKITCCECGPWILWKLARCYWAWCYKELCKSLNSLKLWTRKVHQLPWRKTYSRSCDMASVSCIHDIQHQCLPFLQKWFIRNKQVACPPPSAWIIVITSIYQAFAKVPGTIYRCCGKSFFDMQFKTNLG